MHANHNAIVDLWIDFYNRYSKQAIGDLARNYPSDEDTLYVDYQDMVAFDVDFADDFMKAPADFHEAAEDALQEFDAVGHIDLTDARVRVVGLPDTGAGSPTYHPGELRAEHTGEYVAITGTLDAVTFPSQRPKETVWVCQKCGHEHEMVVDSSSVPKPYQCANCTRQGPFQMDETRTEWTDFAELRITNPPDSDVQDASIEGYVVGDLVDAGGEQGLMGRATDDVVVYAFVEAVEEDGDDGLYDRVLRVEAIEFEDDEDEIDIAAHRDEFEALAADEDVLELWKRSLGHSMYATPAWERGFKFGIVYLFGAPRVDLPNGPTYRGDPHMLLVSDFGTGKSSFTQNVELYSPKCVSKSATGLGSDVGLTATAVEDDFGAGQWSIKPGILARANGGHVILDEIDKGPDNLNKINDAIEGKQQVDVEKAGKSVTYNSRCGLMALANPKEGRFNGMDAIGPQIGIDSSLLSRFDAILTMEDTADEEIDAKVASTAGNSYREAQEAQYGDREEFEELEREIPVDVGRAWVKHARENVHPVLTEEHISSIKEWYAEDIRPLNKEYGNPDADGGDMPVPATARVVETCMRASMAFARVRLKDEVTELEVAEAKQLVKELVGQTWKNGRASPPEIEASQNDRIRNITDLCREEQRSLEELVEETGMDRSKVEHEVQKLKDKGTIYEPTQGEFEAL